MKLREKLEYLGFDSNVFPVIEQYLDDMLMVLALVEPEKTYYLYQHYIEDVSIEKLAQTTNKVSRTIQRYLHGTEKKVGAEDLFLFLLQIYFEAEYLVTAGDVVISCFSEAVSGGKNPVKIPFHRSFFRVLVEALDPHDPLESLPWSKAAERGRSIPYPLRHIVWPAFCPPLDHDKLPGVLTVIRDTGNSERPWLCLIILLAAERSDLWGQILELLNPPNVKCLGPRRGQVGKTARQDVTLRAQKLLDSLTDPFEKNALLAVLANGPCDWKRLAPSDLADLDPNQRVRVCAQEALRHLS